MTTIDLQKESDNSIIPSPGKQKKSALKSLGRELDNPLLSHLLTVVQPDAGISFSLDFTLDNSNSKLCPVPITQKQLSQWQKFVANLPKYVPTLFKFYKGSKEDSFAILQFWTAKKHDPKKRLADLLKNVLVAVDKFLHTIEPFTGRNYAQVILDYLYPLQAGNIDMYAAEILNLRMALLKYTFDYLTYKTLPERNDPIYSPAQNYLNIVTRACLEEERIKIAKIHNPLHEWNSPYIQQLNRVLAEQKGTFSAWWNSKITDLAKEFTQAESHTWENWVHMLNTFATNAAQQFINEKRISSNFKNQKIPPALFQPLIEELKASTAIQLSSVAMVSKRAVWRYSTQKSLAENLQIYLSEPKFLHGFSNTVTENTLDRAFERIAVFMGEVPLEQLFPIDSALYHSFTQLFAQWSTWYTTFAKQQAEIIKEEGLSSALLKCDINVLDTTHAYRDWWQRCQHAMNNFLQSTAANTTKTVLATLQQTLLPNANLAQQQKCQTQLQTLYMRAFLQLVNDRALAAAKAHVEPLLLLPNPTAAQKQAIDNYCNQEHYLMLLTTKLVSLPVVPLQQTRLAQDELTSELTLSRSNSSLSTESLSTVSALSVSLRSGTTESDAVAQSSGIGADIDRLVEMWIAKQNITKDEQYVEDKAIHCMVSFDDHLYTLQENGKFLIQEFVDQYHPKSEKTPLFEHYAQYEKNLYQDIFAKLLTRLCTQCKSDANKAIELHKTLETQHHHLLNGIHVTEQVNRKNFMQELDKLCTAAEKNPAVHLLDKRFHALQTLKTLVRDDLIKFYSTKERHSGAEYDALKARILERAHTEIKSILSTKPSLSLMKSMMQIYHEWVHRFTHGVAEAKERERMVHMEDPSQQQLHQACEQFSDNLMALLTFNQQQTDDPNTSKIRVVR